MGNVELSTKAGGLGRKETAAAARKLPGRGGTGGRRWRPSLSAIAEDGVLGEGEGGKGSRARSGPSVVKLKTPRGAAYFAVAVARSRLWSGR